MRTIPLFLCGMLFLLSGNHLCTGESKKAINLAGYNMYQKMIPDDSIFIPSLIRIYNDPNEPGVPDGKDFRRLICRITGQNLLVSIGFYSPRNLSYFFCYFSTDNDKAAEICVRCQSGGFEVSEETQPGWYNTHLYSGTPNTTTYYYTMELPWTTLFHNLDTVQCWLYAMDGKDRLPDTGTVTISWWELVSVSKTETTLYQGDVLYRQTPEGWWIRTDGKVDDRSHLFFPGSTITNADVTALLDSIGCATTLTNNDAEIWNRAVQVWNWLQTHQLTSGANYTAAQTYYQGLGNWPSIAQIAYMYVHFGGIYWGTCMSRSQLFATLLFGVGIHPDRFAIAEAYWKASYSQHMYVILYLNGHWYYLDPTCIFQSIPASPASIGCTSADYAHPVGIFTLPGSSLSYVPLVE
ncbi:MAG: hypothetical protein JXB88_10490 [Spirochaetales bacterium]|nr:hypothetical protein [Spirochaetales bacterium]